MIKTAIATLAAAAAVAVPSASFAGPYVNVEANAGWTGNDYTGTTTDVHVGYEGALGEDASYYVQGGPALVSADGADLETRCSGEAGLGVGVTESLGVYTEVSFLTDGDDTVDNLGVGGKLGVKYSF